MKKKQKILVVAAHPDDEILGCGGTMAKHAQAGDEVQVLILAQGLTSRDSSVGQKKLDQLHQTAIKANKSLGVKKVHFAQLPDNKLDTVALLDIAKVVEDRIDKFQPQIIYTHAANDLNQDHRQTHQAVFVAARPQPGQSVKEIFLFEVPSSTEWQDPHFGSPFMPEMFVDIKSTLKLKLKALKFYKGEMRAWPHSRSFKGVESLANWRGSSIGVEAAEAFLVGRSIR